MYNILSFTTICCVLCASCSFAAPSANNQNFQTGEYKPEQFSKASPNNEAVHVLPLTQRSVGTATSAGYVQSLRKGTQVNGVYGNSKVTSVESGLVFVTEIEVGGEAFTAVVDTGSSDTWLVETGFTCAKGDQSFCQFGDTYNKTNTFQPIANENFAISYSDGELLTGSFGKEKVTVAGITVNDQQIAVVTRANWNGDGYSSGVLGLGFPANTKAYSGVNPGANSQNSRVGYNPFFTSAYTEGNVPPLFSLALSPATQTAACSQSVVSHQFPTSPSSLARPSKCSLHRAPALLENQTTHSTP
ncbi:hypothetical protein N7G274_005568 [Stereocaulon virgatum]|uniref:Peptidase A1 domain-containing protein n=1 Tax=Stereocaulon virgatum TaxID=373712 RepID=A0ABR4A8F6_9LECA